MITVLAFDLGLTRAAPTAAALVRFEGLAPRLLWVCALRPALADSTSWGRRVGAIGQAALDTARLAEADYLAYEGAHFQRNHQTMRKLAALEGAILLGAQLLGLPVLAIQPAEGKAALASDSRADKAMMIAAAQRLGYSGSSSHEADAIGVALAAEAQIRQLARVANGWAA